MTLEEERKMLLEEIADTPKSSGKTLMMKYLKGGKLSASQSIKAQCFCCNGYYLDGLEDCEDPTCPLYPFMSYKKKKGKK